MKIIAAATAKGGVGKTTATIQVSAFLADAGKKVLLIDVDSQGNLGDQYGIDGKKTLATFLREPERGVDVLTVRENIDLVLSGKDELYKTMKFLIMDSSPLKVMSRSFDFLSEYNYDYVLIDTSPTLTLMNDNALYFCDSVLIPFSIGYFDIAGADQLVSNIEKLNKTERAHKPIEIEGVFINFFDERTNIAKGFEGMLKDKFGKKLLNTRIHRSVTITEAPLQNKTLLEYAPSSRAAQEWKALTAELLNNG